MQKYQDSNDASHCHWQVNRVNFHFSILNNVKFQHIFAPGSGWAIIAHKNTTNLKYCTKISSLRF